MTQSSHLMFAPLLRWLCSASLATTVFAALPSEALGCGGFFCSQAQPVNQAAERIVFADNGDGTVTAVIQIMYEGPAEAFSWLLPISTVPEGDDIRVSSDRAFASLQTATNPQYTLTTRIEGECKQANPGVFDADGDGVIDGFDTNGDAVVDTPPESPVTVEAYGVAGSFEWTVISFDPELAAPEDAAVEWLTDNGYDVTDAGAELIGPYLQDGMYLLAIKLVKGASVGSIRPIVITYDADEPAIPIKLTAVAANDDMGVMPFLLSSSRGVPSNYLALELNEARINWFNAAPTYNDVIIAAAKEAGGQGFVTEFAAPSTSLAEAVWSASDESRWQEVNGLTYQNLGEMIQVTSNNYGGWDGYWESVESVITLPESVSLEDFRLCPNCYLEQVEFSPEQLFEALESGVIEPVRLVQDLIDASAYTTRLYTTMSAADMTLDPSFTFNPDLPDVDNIHSAERIIECSSAVFEWEAPWRIELPQGGVVRGGPADVGRWPAAAASQPANLALRQLSASGEGLLVQDNSEAVEAALAAYNDSLSLPSSNSAAASTGGGAEPEPGATADAPTGSSSGGGCSVGSNPTGAWLLMLGLLAPLLIRRRRADVR